MKIEKLELEKMKTKEWLPQYDELLQATLDMRKRSYTPYSHYNVAAMLVAKDGTVIKGCNIENAAYGPTICAERTAMFKAVSEGIKDFDAIMIIGGSADKEGGDIAAPCGTCRQVLREFCDPDTFYIILPKANENRELEEFRVYTLAEMLPDSFGPDNLA